MNSLKITVGENSVLKIDGDSRRTSISCEKGTISVTRQNDAEDHILSGNQSFVISKKGRVITWALSDASIAISLPDANKHGLMEKLRRFITL
ncbi:MAG: DUF2917 domain-containing protein [Nitrospirae bacterium]|nr:DUF2917 domain-containing protein [Nitrospirota bacterium]